MNIYVNLQRDRIKNIGIFDRDNENAFPDSGMQRRNLTRLAQIGARLTQIIGDQNVSQTGSQGATANKDNALAAIKSDLTDLSQVSIALEDEHPDLRAAFKLPEQNRDQLWLDLADVVPDKLSPHLEEFTEAGLEPDFLTDLAKDVAAYNQADSAHESGVIDRAGDTKEVSTLVSEATKLVKKLDVYGEIRFKKDPDLLQRWNTASRLGDPRRAHRKKTPPTS